MSRFPAELGVPEGWFAVAFTHELKPGRVTSGVLAGQPIVVWRTASGHLGASRAHCPHLGAHLGRGGTVEGETLRCPFHGFRFGLDGGCVATGYGTRPPQAATLATIPVIERHGAALAWHHPAGDPPGWTIPAADPAAGPADSTGGDSPRPSDAEPEPAVAEPRWGPLRVHTYELAGHPQETSENSVDLGHLAIVHGYRRVEPLAEAEADGPVLRVAYAMERPLGLPGTDRVPGLRRMSTRVTFRATLHGLGVSVVEASIPRLGVRTHQLVLATPTEPGRIILRIGMRLALPPPPGRAAATNRAAQGAAALATRLATEAALLGFRHDVDRDVPIWAAKAYLASPVLAAGDGPILAYRRWVAQFYPARPAAD